MTALVQKSQVAPKIGWEVLTTISAMVLFTLFEFGLHGVEIPVALILGMSTLNFFLVLFLYFGIAMLTYQGHTWLLWGCGLAVYIVGFLFTGLDFAWTMIAQWSMILFGGAVIGRLTLKQEPQLKIYTIGMLSVILFSMAMYLPLLSTIIEGFSNMSTLMIENTEVTLVTAGYSATEIATMTTTLKKSMSYTQHVIPSLLLLSSVLQFSIGYLVFVHFLSKKENDTTLVTSFPKWKMPYYATSIILGAACLRFFGNESLMRIGDNTLLFLAFFYSICGLSLMEHFLKKLKFPPLVKLCFYILIFLTQLVGFIVAVFLGFIDSFKDFRNKEQLNLQNE